MALIGVGKPFLLPPFRFTGKVPFGAPDGPESFPLEAGDAWTGKPLLLDPAWPLAWTVGMLANAEGTTPAEYLASAKTIIAPDSYPGQPGKLLRVPRAIVAHQSSLDFVKAVLAPLQGELARANVLVALVTDPLVWDGAHPNNAISEWFLPGLPPTSYQQVTSVTSSSTIPCLIPRSDAAGWAAGEVVSISLPSNGSAALSEITLSGVEPLTNAIAAMTAGILADEPAYTRQLRICCASFVDGTSFGDAAQAILESFAAGIGDPEVYKLLSKPAPGFNVDLYGEDVRQLVSSFFGL